MMIGWTGGRGSGVARAAITALALAVLAACAASSQVVGPKSGADAGSAGGQAATVESLQAGAPAWFSPWWQDYLRRAQAGYAVLALDRNGRGGWYVYCGTDGCHHLDHVRARSITDVHYGYRALDYCRERIAQAHPGARPDCALFAIRDRIVWQGPPPWAGNSGEPATADGHAVVGATPDLVGVNQLLDLIEFWQVRRPLD